ncbi:TonB-dependent receptor [Segetibacter koreensis]|uniref:TonB-dependent receptor n=1 Tax=Segetibacter koreensis TaxID=398037 RepID=UPI0003650F84|nr:TonB-dependent receptor [Segetibacter koreensis]
MQTCIRFTLLFWLTITITLVNSQKLLEQTLKGQIVDEISKSPIQGATITLISNSSVTAISEKNGFFSLTKVPVGRQSIVISFVGYENQVINEILVTSGKEAIINASLTEKITKLKEVVVKGSSKRVVNNEMVTVSGRSFNSDDARKYAGALGDPSRMVAAFAGVSSSNDSRNDIIVRGNSPTGLLWQIEGIDIPNPNHYGSLSSTGGPVSILNTNNLGKSDFLTGAFPAQYGNAIASVFDLKLKNGNTDRKELLAEVSFTGFELGAEGPISMKHGSSYIFNYRYSTVGLLNTFGLNVGTGKAAPQYQDLNFKVLLPVSEKTKISFFGLGGPSKITFLGADVDSKNENLYSAQNENLFTKYFTGIIGSTVETNFSQKTYGKLSIGFSNTSENIQHDSISASAKKAFRDAEHEYTTNRFSLSYMLSHKFNPKNSIVAGTNNSLIFFDLFDKRIYGGGISEKINLDQKNHMTLLQAYAQWKHRFSENISLNAGVHFQTVTLNNKSALEPRIGLKYVTPDKNILSFGYGFYSFIQSPLVYFYQTLANGAVVNTNKNLGFTKSQQFVGSYDFNISNNMHLKTELYYQLITDAPVETKPNGFSLLNEGAGFGTELRDSLVNNGKGRNYGVEYTLEKYFTKGSYFLITASFFDSKYKGSNGIERNTAFNTKYAFNVLAGRDFKVGKKNNTFSVNAKLSSIGGKYISPIDVTASQNSNTTTYDENISPFSLKQAPYFRADMKLGYRKNNKKSTLEFGIDLKNFTMHDNIFVNKYNRGTNRIVSQYQQGFLPVPYFKLTF